jgi:hypothetical protein
MIKNFILILALMAASCEASPAPAMVRFPVYYETSTDNVVLAKGHAHSAPAKSTKGK